MREKIIVVDDEVDVADLISLHLEKAEYDVSKVTDSALALDQIRREMPALIVLDLMLPGLSGMEICRILKSDSQTARILIIMLTAKADEADRISGFEVGTDDYVVKPFSPRELVLRVNAVLRRNTESVNSAVLVAGKIVIDQTKHSVLVGGKEIDCTATEFNLLCLLIQRRGKVQSRLRLLSDVWDYDGSTDSRTVDTHMRRLRDKLGIYSSYLETVRGFGYRLREKLPNL